VVLLSHPSGSTGRLGVCVGIALAINVR